jgi:hypothetical protein
VIDSCADNQLPTPDDKETTAVTKSDNRQINSEHLATDTRQTATKQLPRDRYTRQPTTNNYHRQIHPTTYRRQIHPTNNNKQLPQTNTPDNQQQTDTKDRYTLQPTKNNYQTNSPGNKTNSRQPTVNNLSNLFSSALTQKILLRTAVVTVDDLFVKSLKPTTKN